MLAVQALHNLSHETTLFSVVTYFFGKGLVFLPQTIIVLLSPCIPGITNMSHHTQFIG
jgi:hypothetical protein